MGARVAVVALVVVFFLSVGFWSRCTSRVANSQLFNVITTNHLNVVVPFTPLQHPHLATFFNYFNYERWSVASASPANANA